MREWIMRNLSMANVSKRNVFMGNLLRKILSVRNQSPGSRFGKKCLAGLLVLLACMSASLRAQADLIWEPQDSFYEKHAEECTYVNRFFEANGPDGKVILYQSPEMPIEKGSWENGYRAYISFIYTDSEGIEWGIYDNDAKLSGWVPMAYMEVVYDSISFKEEHSAEIVEQQGEVDSKYQGEVIYLWKYPGSEEGDTFEVKDYPPSYRGVYVDEEGRSWGCIGYYFGIKDKWVCLDQPTADFARLYPEGIAGPEENRKELSSESKKPDTGETERIVPKINDRVVIIAAIMVAAVVLATAALLIIIRKRLR